MNNRKPISLNNLIRAVLMIEAGFLLLPRLALDFISVIKHLSNFNFQLPHLLMLATLIVELFALYALVWLLINCMQKTIRYIPKLVWVGLVGNLLLLVLGDLFLWIPIKNWPDPVFAYASTYVIAPTALIIMRWELAKSSAPFKVLLTGHFVLTAIPIISAGLVAYWYFTAPPPGFCVAKNRFIPEEEFVKRAIQYQGNEHKIINGKYSVLACCTVSPMKHDFWSKMLRIDEGVGVGWYYERTPEAITSLDPDRYHVVDITFDSCLTRSIASTGINEKKLPNYSSIYSKYNN